MLIGPINKQRAHLFPGLKKQFVEDYYKAGGTGAYKEGNPTAGFYEDGIAKMAYKRIFIKHKKK